MQRDLGLTASEARERLAAERTAADLEPKARDAAGNAYGGSWFDAGANQLTVAVTAAASASTVRAVRATGAAVRTVEYSARTLDTAKSRIDRQTAPDGVSNWYVDPAANSLVVGVVEDKTSDNDVQRFLDQARKAGPITVKTVASAPAPSPRARSAATRTTPATSAVP